MVATTTSSLVEWCTSRPVTTVDHSCTSAAAIARWRCERVVATTVQPFTIASSAIEGLIFIAPKVVDEDRGAVREFFRLSAFEEVGITALGRFVQINVTQTLPGAIRGMHAEDMHKLVGVVAGTAFGAWVDLRPGPNFATVVTADMYLGVQVLVPPGVANGFQATGTSPCQYVYAFDDEWVPDMAGTAVTPLDAELGIPWPIVPRPDDPASVSVKDASAPTLAEVREAV